jgi:hypothetical protein
MLERVITKELGYVSKYHHLYINIVLPVCIDLIASKGNCRALLGL